MGELVPVLLGVFLGTVIWSGTRGLRRLALSIFAVLACGLFATVVSGEYVESWVYGLLDVGETATGLAAGFAFAHYVPPAIRNLARLRAHLGDKPWLPPVGS